MNNTITLKDKGVLGFSEFGDPSGEPVFFFHGSGGSRLDHPADGTILNEIGIKSEFFYQFLIYRSYLLNEISSCLSCLNIMSSAGLCRIDSGTS